MVHPQRLLHEGAKQHFAVTYGARLYVHHEAKGSVSVVVPLKVVRSDLCTTARSCGPETLKPLRQVDLILRQQDQRFERRSAQISGRESGTDHSGGRQHNVVIRFFKVSKFNH